MKLLWIGMAFTLSVFSAESIRVTVDFGKESDPTEMDRMGLGQGGLADGPMWDTRVTEIAALKPRLIRLFIQEYFDLLPSEGKYHFETLDRSVDMILATGAKPLMCICFKPRTLFPKVDQDVVDPNDYGQWQNLIATLVKHYQERQAGIEYWEVANEPDIGESGGCPYRFNPENYPRYYEQTVAAILRADPKARVGGPALANSRSSILPALLDFCDSKKAPLGFVSWHIYSSSPQAVRGTIEYVKGLLAKHPSLHPELFLDEWNMDLTNPPLDPRFQPCYVAETVWQMKDGGLDYSCYYHIRDWYVCPEQFAPFMSSEGTAMMARWWNRMPQFDGLFDYQNTIRPSYFAFKLLSRMAGNKIAVTTTNGKVHGFATHDPALRMHNLLLWNFSAEPAQIEIVFSNQSRDFRIRHITLDATTGSSDENARLRPEPPAKWTKDAPPLSVIIEPYAIHYWSLE